MARSRIACGERIEKARGLKESVLAGNIPSDAEIAAASVGAEVLESWARVMASGLTPEQADGRVEIPPAEFLELKRQHARMVEVAESTLPSFAQRDTNTFCALAVLDGACRLIYAVARGSAITGFLEGSGVAGRRPADSAALMGSAGNLLFYGGFDYAEGAIGTTAWSICAETAEPAQIVSTEQYSRALSAYDQVISAMPILAADGSVDYVIAYCHFLDPSLLESPYDSCAKADMDYLASMTGVIEARVRFYNPDIPTMAVRKSVRDHGLILADASGAIVKISARAKAMVGLEPGGKPKTLRDLFPADPAFAELICRGGRYETRMRVLDSEGVLTVSAEAHTVAASAEGCSIVVRLFEDAPLGRFASTLHARPKDAFGKIIGTSATMKRAKKLCSQFSASGESILITGESGTGKEMFARAIHDSSRPDGPFVAFEAATIPTELVLPSLFGYEPETLFPNQKVGRPGLIERASRGTLFLDEVADIPTAVQSSLLRALETGRVSRVGGLEERLVDFRVVATTSFDVAALVRRGALRRNFLHRVSVLEVSLPPLRDRVSDIRALAESFLEEYCTRASMPIPAVDEKFFATLESCEWPGNVRQLQNAIAYAVNVALAQGDVALAPKHLPETVTGPRTPTTPSPDDEKPDASEEFNLARIERQTILRAWRRTDGDTSRMAAMLGMSPSTLGRRLRQYGIRR